jgi:hypothetical protein
MAYERRLSVMSPEVGVQKGEGGFSPFGAAPSARGGPPPGMRPPAPASPYKAKRLDTLENKTVYLVDIGFGGGIEFMQQLQEWFAEHMPSVNTIKKRKPGNVFMDDNDTLWEEVKEKGDAVVVGVAG